MHSLTRAFGVLPEDAALYRRVVKLLTIVRARRFNMAVSEAKARLRFSRGRNIFKRCSRSVKTETRNNEYVRREEEVSISVAY